jgi:hypothetical protein
MRHPAGYISSDHRRNIDISEEPEADPVEKKLTLYKQRLLNRVNG